MKSKTKISQTVEAEFAGEFDVCVAGAGTAGCIAATAAGRAGAKTILIEQSGYLGGMMTFGNAGLTKFIPHGNDPEKNKEILSMLDEDPSSVQVVGGIGMEIVERLRDSGGAVTRGGNAGSYVFTDPCKFSLLLLDMLEDSGVKVLLHSFCAETVKKGSRVEGVVVENKTGRQIFNSSYFVDATGDGDLAYKSGCSTIANQASSGRHSMGAMFRAGNVNLDKTVAFLKDNPDRFGLQPFSLMTLDELVEQWEKRQMVCFFVKAGGHNMQIYNSPNEGVVTLCCSCYNGDGTDIEDLTAGQLAMMRTVNERVEIMRKEVPGFENSFLIDMPSVGVRESRHIEGEYVLTAEDILNDKEFEDTIGKGGHPVDIRPIRPEIEKYNYGRQWVYNIPYRCLAAKGVDNLLLAGRCISNTHEASGCTRVTAACFVTGHAAGTAAAVANEQKISLQALDTALLRAKLKEQKAVL